MDNYQKLKAVQGLIMSLDEQIYRYEKAGKFPNPKPGDNIIETQLIDQYFTAIREVLDGKEIKS